MRALERSFAILLLAASLLALAPAQEGEDFAPARLAPPADDATLHLARGLWLARQGDLTRAASAAARALECGPEDERVVRGAGRLAQLHATREAWIAELLAGRGKLFLVRGGKRAALKVAGYEDGVLRFAKNSLGLAESPVDALPVAELFDLARGLPADTPHWVVPYARLLGGLPEWDEGLDEDSPEARALAEDAAGLGRLFGLGEVCAGLARLAEVELGADGLPAPEAAADVLERTAAIVARADGLEVVHQRRDDLRELARRALNAEFQAHPERLPLAGELEWSKDGRLKLTYDFEEVADAEDFVLRNDYLHEWHATMSPVDKTPEESYFVVRQGAFFGDGQLVYRHRLEFGPGVRVAYEMRYIQREGDTIDVGVVMIGLADDGAGSFAAASEFGDRYAIDLETFYNRRELYEGERLVEINTIYRAEARLEPDDELGAVVEAWRDGEKRGELGTGGRYRGGVFLYVHSPRIVAIESMVIEGVPEPASIDALREAWVAERLAELGLAR